MFQVLYIFGPAAIAYLIAEKLSGNKQETTVRALIKITAYAAVIAQITSLILYSRGLVEFIIMPNGIRNIQYGRTAFLLATGLSVVAGFVSGVIAKRINIDVTIVPVDETEKQD